MRRISPELEHQMTSIRRRERTKTVADLLQLQLSWPMREDVAEFARAEEEAAWLPLAEKGEACPANIAGWFRRVP
jgi:hypothetical protein